MNGEMFVEVEFENGEMFRIRQSLEFYDADCRLVFGEWFAPLPNERGNSFAFGLLESLVQSDEYSGLFYAMKSGVYRVRIWKID